MTERIDVKITADGSGLVRAGKEAEKAVKQLGTTIDQAGRDSRNAFRGVADSARRIGFTEATKDARDLGSAINNIGKNLGSIRGAKVDLSATLNTGGLEEAAKAIQNLGKGAGAFSVAMKGGSSSATATATAIMDTSKAMQELTLTQQASTQNSILHTAAILGSAGATFLSARATGSFQESLAATLVEQQRAIELTTQLEAAKARLALATQAELKALEEENKAQERFDASRSTSIEGMKATAEAYEDLQLATQNLDAAMEDTITTQTEVAKLEEQLAVLRSKQAGDTGAAAKSNNIFQESMNKLKEQLTQTFPSLEKVFNGIDALGGKAAKAAPILKGLAVIGVGLAAALPLLGAAIKGVEMAMSLLADSAPVKEIMEAEKAAAGLAASFSGAETELSKVNTVITTLGETSKAFDTDALAQAATDMRLMGASGDQISQLLPIATDLAESLGIDVTDAASKMVLGIQGNERALKGLGIVVKDGATPLERYEAVLKRSASASLAATEMAGGLTGKVNALKKAQGEFAESLGRALEGPLSGMLEWLTNAVNKAGELAIILGKKFGITDFLKPTGGSTTTTRGGKTPTKPAGGGLLDYAGGKDKTGGTQKTTGGAAGGGVTTTTPKEAPSFPPMFLKNLEARVETLFSAESLDTLGKQLLVMPLSLDTMKKAIEIVGKRFTTLAAEAEQFQLDKAKQEAENTAFALQQAKQTAQEFEDGLKLAKEKLDAFADAMAQTINTVTEAAGSLARGDIRGAVGTGISAIGEFGGSLGKAVAAVLGAVQTAFVIGDEHQQANLEREAANQELFRANLEKFGISVETMSDTQKDLAVKLGMKTQGAADLEKARTKAAGTLQAGGLGDIAGLAATLTEAQATEVAKLVANGDLEGAATMLYGLAGKTRPEGYYRPYISPAMAEAGVYVPDMPTGVAAPLSQTQQATLVTALNTLIDAIRPPGGATDGVAAPAQVQGTDPRNPVYVFDVTPAEEQFMFAPRSYFFRAAAEARAVM